MTVNKKQEVGLWVVGLAGAAVCLVHAEDNLYPQLFAVLILGSLLIFSLRTRGSGPGSLKFVAVVAGLGLLLAMAHKLDAIHESAMSAESAAEEARDNASAAQQTADEAKTAAQDADSSASNAESAAQGAQKAAEEAQSAAEDARDSLIINR
jgi:Sec-independent protein translocase protein TatA